MQKAVRSSPLVLFAVATLGLGACSDEIPSTPTRAGPTGEAVLTAISSQATLHELARTVALAL
jgi:hypothetical protein